MERKPQDLPDPGLFRPELLSSSSVKVRLEVLGKFQDSIQKNGKVVTKLEVSES